MHPILLCSVLGLAIILERLYYFAKARHDTRRLMGGCSTCFRTRIPRPPADAARQARADRGRCSLGLLRAKKGPEAVEKAIETAASIQTPGLERGLHPGSRGVANIAPLLGFLGTVSGMIPRLRGDPPRRKRFSRQAGRDRNLRGTDHHGGGT